MKYEIKGSWGNYQILYGKGYPYSDFIRYWVFTMWGCKRVIRRHKKRLASGKLKAGPGSGNPYEIVYTEEALTSSDVEKRIRELEHELGIS